MYKCIYMYRTAFCLRIGSRSLQLQMDLQFLTKPLESQARPRSPSGVVASSSDIC